MKNCKCGARLPTHLLGIVDDKYAHVCSCLRAYRPREGVFVLVGRVRDMWNDPVPPLPKEDDPEERIAESGCSW